MPTELKTVCLPNPTGISNISLIKVPAIERFQILQSNNISKVDLRIYQSYLEQDNYQVNVSFGNDLATLSYASQPTPDGNLHTYNMLIKPQLINPSLTALLNNEFRINSRFIAYIVYRNGQAFIIGTPDNPFILKSISESPDLAALNIGFECICPSAASLILSDSEPHFFQVSSHAFTNHFYNFE